MVEITFVKYNNFSLFSQNLFITDDFSWCMITAYMVMGDTYTYWDLNALVFNIFLV